MFGVWEVGYKFEVWELACMSPLVALVPCILVALVSCILVVLASYMLVVVALVGYRQV